MNSDIDGVALGLKGRLNCRVIGPISKGNVLVSTFNGCLRKAEKSEYMYKVAIANETCDIEGEILIECIL